MGAKRRKKKRFLFHNFDNDPLTLLPATKQIEYIKCYLSDLGAIVTLEEPYYFDRDYLDEFSAFYCRSTHSYPNVCRRLHFFSSKKVTRDKFRSAAKGVKRSIDFLNEYYLGFTIIRPITSSPLGRTVLRWYPDDKPNTPRIVRPSRPYECHIAGFTLTVTGLAWQQQDSAVAACATIGLWSLLHSSAFDDNHAIPTTAEITRAANKSNLLGKPTFPSTGLDLYQLSSAIKELGFTPIILEGNNNEGRAKRFSRERFCSSSAAFIRSGYPIIIAGELHRNGGHAICATGFRDNENSIEPPSELTLQDCHIEHIYIHDDNLGPNVRFKITEDHNQNIVLETHPPPPRIEDPSGCSPTVDYPAFTPTHILVAVHDELRTSPDTLHRKGLDAANEIAYIFNTLLSNEEDVRLEITIGTRFILNHEYLSDELPQLLSDTPNVLAKVRLSLQENASPMSLHIGLVRIALKDLTPLVDILYDTTDSDRNHPVYFHVSYNSGISAIMNLLQEKYGKQFGELIEAY